MRGLHAYARFRWVRFRGGSLDGHIRRQAAPLPPRLLVPVTEGRARTWGADETRLVGVDRYRLAPKGCRGLPLYTIVKGDSDGGDHDDH